MAESLPNFVIIGAMRSGTTSLFGYLSAHPGVFMPTRKEIHYFSREYARGIEWYKQQFRGATTGQAIGEASPSYFTNVDAPARMAAVIPQAKLIAILRDPVDRAYSHYWFNRSRGLETREFAAAIATRNEVGEPSSSYLQVGYYLANLHRVCQNYPREALQVLLLEDLHDHPQQTFQEICRFLEIEENFIPGNLGAVVNAYVAFRSARLRKLSRYLLRRRLQPWPIYRAIARFNRQKDVSYPPMNPGLRAELQRHFAEHNAALAAWLGRDLSQWKPQPVTAD